MINDNYLMINKGYAYYIPSIGALNTDSYTITLGIVNIPEVRGAMRNTNFIYSATFNSSTPLDTVPITIALYRQSEDLKQLVFIEDINYEVANDTIVVDLFDSTKASCCTLKESQYILRGTFFGIGVGDVPTVNGVSFNAISEIISCDNNCYQKPALVYKKYTPQLFLDNASTTSPAFQASINPDLLYDVNKILLTATILVEFGISQNMYVKIFKKVEDCSPITKLVYSTSVPLLLSPSGNNAFTFQTCDVAYGCNNTVEYLLQLSSDVTTSISAAAIIEFSFSSIVTEGSFEDLCKSI